MGPVVLFYLPGSDTGGIATSFRSLAAFLESRGMTVKVLLPYAADVSAADIPSRYVVGFARRRRIRNRLATRLLNLFNALTRYRFFFVGVPRIRHDVFVVYQTWYNAHWRRYSRRPTVGWLHGMAEPPYGTLGDRLRSWSVGRDLERFGRTVAVSDEVADSYVTRYGLRRRPQVIRNLADIDRIVRKGGAVGKACPAGHRLAFVGRLSPEKGLLRLLQAFVRLRTEAPDLSIDVVGDGEEREACMRFAEMHGLAGAVRFEGLLEDPLPAMRRADLLVVPSLHEGCPCVIGESLLVRTPVLATDCGGTRTALRGGDWGLLVPNTDEGLCEGLRKWLADGSVVLPREGFDAVERELRSVRRRSCGELAALFDGALGGCSAGGQVDIL